MKPQNRSMMWTVACAVILSLAAARPGAAGTVTSLADDGSPGTLRYEIANATAGDTIDFTVSGTITLASGELVIDKDLTILGPGPASLAVDGNATGRVFFVWSAGSVTIAGLTITNGLHTGIGYGGSGVYSEFSSLLVSNCVLSGNVARYGGAIYSLGLAGVATLTVIDSTLSGNEATSHGGAIYNDGAYNGRATATVVDSVLIGNTATYTGGAIYNDSYDGTATLVVVNSIVSSNAADTGGAVYNSGYHSGHAILTMTNSTFSDNAATGAGGAIYNDGAAGGAILTVVDSTLSGNAADWAGGSIYNDGYLSGHAALTVVNSTLSGNAAQYGGGIFGDASEAGNLTLTVAHSTLSGNSASDAGHSIYSYVGDSGSATLEIGDTILQAGASSTNFDGYGSLTVTSHGYNLCSDDGGGYLTATGDQVNTDPLLGPLQDNGGPTWTHALLAGSPALNAGNPGFAPPPDYDQRGPGYPRVANDRIDIGAFEYQGPIPPANSPPVADAGTNQTFTVAHDGDPATDTVAVDLDGSGSSDPDSDALTYSWMENATEIATGVSPSVNLAAGVHSIALTVTDPASESDTDTVSITVDAEPNQSPTANAGQDQTVTAGAGGTATVALNGTGSSDPDSDALTYSWATNGVAIATGAQPSVSLAEGTHALTLTVTDPYGAEDTDAVTLTVSAAPPVLTVGTAILAHKGKTITVGVPITNTGTEVAYNVGVTAATLDNGTLTSSLPSLKNIRPGTTKSVTVKFSASNTATGSQTFTLTGTSSLGAFSTAQTVTVP